MLNASIVYPSYSAERQKMATDHSGGPGIARSSCPLRRYVRRHFGIFHIPVPSFT